MPTSLEDLLTNVGAYKQGASAATQQIVALTGSQVALSSADAEVYKQVATDNSTVTAAAQAAALRTQSQKVQAANAFHTNLGDVTEQITKYAAAADSAQQAKDDALAEISRKDSVTLFDNPLEYIMNQFTINGDIAKHNAANAQLESANARIQSMNANTQTTVQTQNAISEPLTAASAEAATRNAAAQATIEANKSSQQGLAYNINGIQAALNEKKEVLGFQFQANQAVNTERQIGISLAHLDLAKKEFAQKQKEYQERKDDREEQQALGENMVATVNRGRVAMGLPEMDDMNGKMILASLKSKTPISAQTQKFYEAGQASEAAGVNIISATPAGAAAALAAVPTTKLNPTQLPIKTMLSVAAGEVSNAMTPAGQNMKGLNPALKDLNPKDQTAIATAMNNVAQTKLNQYGAVINAGDASNPYQIPSVNALIENSPTIAALPVVQKVLAPLTKNGVQLTDPKMIFAAVGDAVAKGTITHAEALELSTVYHVGVKTNLAMRNLPAFGLTPTLGYRTPLETAPEGFHSTEVVDMTQPDSLSRALMRRQSTILRIKMAEGGVSMTPKFNAAVDSADAQFQALFTPQPQAAAALSNAVDNANKNVDNMFNNLPHSSDARKTK